MFSRHMGSCNMRELEVKFKLVKQYSLSSYVNQHVLQNNKKQIDHLQYEIFALLHTQLCNVLVFKSKVL